ncbi:hypothetical protein D3C72_1883990 [compost metagenome]
MPGSSQAARKAKARRLPGSATSTGPWRVKVLTTSRGAASPLTAMRSVTRVIGSQRPW